MTDLEGRPPSRPGEARDDAAAEQSARETSQHLRDAASGNSRAIDRLVPLVYDDLRRIASAIFRRNPAATLQPTELIGEALLRLTHYHPPSEDEARHFKRVAGFAMRNVLADYVRRKKTRKLGGDRERVPLTPELAVFEEESERVLAVDDALREYERLDPEAAEVVVLRYFGGYSHDEIADLIRVSLATAKRRWRRAKAWLECRLGESFDQR